MFAICAPVVNPTLASAAKPSASRIHDAATSSITDAAGDRTYKQGF
jgi:hypothetical protein